MKLKINLLKIVLGILLLSWQVGCSSNKNSSTGTTSGTTYYNNNGSCYASNTGQIVDSSKCTSSSGYYLANGSCYSYSTGAVVASTYCSTTSTSGAICVGWYWFQGGYVSGYYYPAGQYYCNSSTTGHNNCSGVTMTSLNQSNYGQQLLCQ